MTHILGIDPGSTKAKESTTGIALGYYTDTVPYTLVDSWNVPGGFEGFRMWTKVAMHEPSVVVCEHFVNWNVKGADITACFIEGAVRWIWPEVVLQGASGKNTAVPDAALKRLGAYTTGGHHHDAREATRHSVMYLKNQGHLPTLLKGWPKT